MTTRTKPLQNLRSFKWPMH
uniref:Uncharacterized protein n=1 Tax=Anguilla anguilla TaxID=7936 RepID=A0A0E9Q3K4_ANGAN